MNTFCGLCNKSFSRPEHLQRHTETGSHQRKRQSLNPPTVIIKKMKLQQPAANPDFNIRLIHRGLDDLFKIYRAQMKRVCRDFVVLTALLLAHFTYLIERAVADTKGIKGQLRCKATFYRDETDAERNVEHKERSAWFSSKQQIYLHSTMKETEVAKAMAEISKQIEQFIQNGSGWSIKEINFMDLYISKYAPIRGTTYSKLPPALSAKKAIINVQNGDDKCFMWSVLASLHPVENHPHRVSKYRSFTEELKFDGLQMPMALDDIPAFEQLNGLAINVFGFGEGLYPLYITKDRIKQPINLLLLTPEDKPAHYCLIKDLSRLLFQETKHANRKHICPYCLCPFNSEKRLEKHQIFCTADKQRVEMPEDPILKFRNVHRQIRTPYVMYADFECFLQPQSDGKVHHVPNSYGLLGVRQCCSDPCYQDPLVYRDENPVQHFLETVIQRGEAYQKEHLTPLYMTPDNSKSYRAVKTCHICNGTCPTREKVRDHCHQCGKYRGAAHSTCNTKLYESKDITVLFHNLRKYDGHLIMQELGSVAKDRGLKLECIAKGAEDYICFSIRMQTGNKRWKLRFVDSMAFLNASLDTLVHSAPKDQFVALQMFTEHPNLLLQKGFYPYEHVDSAEKFRMQELPNIHAFYSSLRQESVAQKDYDHAKAVWDAHKFTNFGQYHDLYLLTDVLLLADIFQGFRDFSMTNYGLDPAHYVTLPSYAWDALLKFSGVELELLQDPDMFQFFTAGIRGGISVISHRHAKANHNLLGETKRLDSKNETSMFIIYVDANNLYGWAMKKPLPVGDFKWIGALDRLPPKTPGIGYVWEVDLDYPEDLHIKHNDYPMAPEHMEIPDLSPYCQRIKQELGIPDIKMVKLVPNLFHKTHYIVHDDNLRLYIKHGLDLKKIHRGIQFKEADWMGSYIDFNTHMRQQATSSFHKDLFKLLNNAVFGKSMENVFNYLDVRLTADPKKYEKLVANPLYKESHAFKGDLTAVMMRKEKAVLNKPIYTGFSVLELSKTLMYKFHYEYMKEKYPDRCTLLFTDTDSFCYKVATQNIYDDMEEDRDEWFDTSDYPPNHFLHSDVNKKRMGMMSDETKGVPISEFVGLRAKMYSIQTVDAAHMRAKGVTRAVVKHQLSHAAYRETLFGGTLRRDCMVGFRSNDHEIYTMKTDKISLSAFDDKRFIMDDGVTTLAYGHTNIEQDYKKTVQSLRLNPAYIN